MTSGFWPRHSRFENDRLAIAMKATFKRRGTEIPEAIPDALSDAFARDDQKRKQWAAFVTGILSEPIALEIVVKDLREFLMSHARAAKAIN